MVRRCADIGDVLAVATTGQASVAVLSAGLRRLDTEAVTRLRLAGVAVVGVHAPADDRARLRLERLGIDGLVPDDAGTGRGAGRGARRGGVDHPRPGAR